QTRAYIGQLAAMSVGGSSALDQLRFAQPITHMGNLRALVFGLTSAWLAPSWIQALTIVLSLFVVGLLAFAEYAKVSHALLVAITAAVIVSYHCFIHDMSILVLPIAIGMSQSLTTGGLGVSDKPL